MRSIPFFLLLLSVLVPATESQTTGSVQTMGATLPTGNEGPAAAWDGKNAYIFGGWDGTKKSDAILRYTPSTDRLTVMTAKLPTPRHGSTAVWIGNAAYIIGGHGCSDRPGHWCDSVVKYDPAIDLASNTSVVWPKAHYYQAAATDGKVAYVFGGADNSQVYRGIIRFDPAAMTATVTEAFYPEGRAQLAAVYDGKAYYTFGGCVGSGVCSVAEIWKYDAATNKLTQLGKELPRENQGASAVWDGSQAWIFGGQDYPAELDQVVRFDTATNGVTLLGAKLPSARYRAAAVWDGQSAYVFGGFVQDHLDDARSTRLRDIVKFTPSAASSEPTQPFVPPAEATKKGLLPALDLVAVLAALAAVGLLLARRRDLR